MPAARAQALSSVASAACADPNLFSATRTLEDAIAAHRALPGMGDWTAHYIAMRVLREPDAFPAADIGLLRALAPPGGGRLSAADAIARAEAWRPWRAYAAQHLWTAEAGTARASTRTNRKDNIDALSGNASGAVHGSPPKPDRPNASHS
jgi:AraC family transcriptional regulator, regulatory protein of adaptative response / DNA-3-methyladenine glycosylase II